MDGNTDYVALLKSARHLKQQIDKFLHKNRNEIDNVEMLRIRKLVEKVLTMFLPHTERCNAANESSMVVQHFNCDNHSAKSNMKELLDISSSFFTGTDTTMKCSNHKQKMSDKKEYRRVTNEDCSSNKQQADLNEKLKNLEEHIKDMDCCIRDFAYFTIKLIRLNQDHKKKETCLEKTVAKLKKKEHSYKCRIQRLSKKLDFARKSSAERQRRTDGMLSEIERLKRTAEKNATDWSDMAKSMSVVAVDLSLSSRRPMCDDDRLDDDNEDDDDDDDDEDDDDNSCDGDYDGCVIGTKNTGGEQQETRCCRPTNGVQSFPAAFHSTPTRSAAEDCPFPKTSPSTVVDWADDDGGERSVLCGSGTMAKTAEKLSRKAESPSPCSPRPSSNPFHPAHKNENRPAETQLPNGMLATNGADSTAGLTTITNCSHCNNNKVTYRTSE